MKKLWVTMVVLCIFYSLSAQTDSSNIRSGTYEKKLKIYKTWISLNNTSNILTGVLYEINDSSISVSNSILREDYSTGKFELSKINFNNIDLVKIRMKNNPVRVALAGAAIGLAAGGLIGLISGDDPSGLLSFSAGEKAMLYGLAFGVGGAGIGALEGLVKINIPIKGRMENFKRNKSRMKKYSITF
jgi:hypothetical protein